MEALSLIGNVIGLISFAVLVLQLIQAYRLKQAMKRRKERAEQARRHGPLVLNFSDHDMTEGQSVDRWLKGCQIVTIASGNSDLTRPVEAAEALLNQLDPEHLQALKQGMPVVVAFPGASILALHLLTVIHAISGSFPVITWSRPSDAGQMWQKPVDLHALRTAGRTRRG